MFKTEDISQREFSNLDKLCAWVANEEKSTSRVPIQGLLKNGAKFRKDKYFGDSEYQLSFTEEGLRALCSELGFPLVALKKVQKKGLASRILNDLLAQNNAKTQLSNSQFVINEKDSKSSHGKVCGIVSNSYVGYSNNSFIRDIKNVMDKKNLSSAGNLTFKEAYSINTRLNLRFTSTHISGSVYGLGGSSEDKTEIGLEFCNSMVGDTPVSIDYFLHRLVCANGMVLPSGRNKTRVIHAGKSKNFLDRLNRAFDDLLPGMGEVAAYVEELNDIEFSPKRLAELNLSKTIFDIIPKSRSTILDEKKHEFSNLVSKRSSDVKFMKEVLALKYLPEIFAGKYSNAVFNSHFRENASMLDLLNVFTEHAKEKQPAERLGIQKRSGQLAEWVVNNKEKFD